MTRNTVLGPFYASMERVNVPVAKLARRRGLPLSGVDDPTLWVPTQAVCRLADDIRAEIGLEATVSWLINACDPSALGPIYQQLQHTASIKDLLEKYREFYLQFRNYAKISWHRRGDQLCIRRWVDRNCVPDSEMLELYALLEFVRIIQELTGIPWTPSEIQVRFGEDDYVKRLPDFAESSVQFGAPYTGIAFPLRLLAMRVKTGKVPSNAPEPNEQALRNKPEAFAECVHAVICSRFGDGYPDVQSVAESIGITARTLQRRLVQEGLTYRKLVDRYRFTTARTRLLSDTARLTDIAAELDYRDLPSFTRAFHRWSGLSPSEYRTFAQRNGQTTAAGISPAVKRRGKRASPID
jgi:AraC-like DNA-binding protein